jgi:hypothetical protein
MKEQLFKVVIAFINKSELIIKDVEKIKAKNLKEATQLARDIQLAELIQSNKSEEELEEYKEAWVSFEHKTGILNCGSEYVGFIFGQDNGWYKHIESPNSQQEWLESTNLEWEDFAISILTLEPNTNDLTEV